MGRRTTNNLKTQQAEEPWSPWYSIPNASPDTLFSPELRDKLVAIVQDDGKIKKISEITAEFMGRSCNESGSPNERGKPGHAEVGKRLKALKKASDKLSKALSEPTTTSAILNLRQQLAELDQLSRERLVISNIRGVEKAITEAAAKGYPPLKDSEQDSLKNLLASVVDPLKDSLANMSQRLEQLSKSAECALEDHSKARAAGGGPQPNRAAKEMASRIAETFPPGDLPHDPRASTPFIEVLTIILATERGNVNLQQFHHQARGLAAEVNKRAKSSKRTQ
jgi:hypothetical protein